MKSQSIVKRSYHNEGEIVEVQLNNPAKKNSLSLALLTQLFDVINDVIINSKNNGNNGNGKRVRVLIVTAAHGAGSTGNVSSQQQQKVFSSGHDLKELQQAKDDGKQEIVTETFRMCSKVMLSIVNAPFPVIASVDGLASAAGLGLVSVCDLVVCSTSAKFQTPGVLVGLFCHTPSVGLIRNVPIKVANHMLYTGDAISASEALQHGLVNKVVANDDDVLKESLALATKIINSASFETILSGKRNLVNRSGKSLSIQEELTQMEAMMCTDINSDTATQGIRSFLNKKKKPSSSL